MKKGLTQTTDLIVSLLFVFNLNLTSSFHFNYIHQNVIHINAINNWMFVELSSMITTFVFVVVFKTSYIVIVGRCKFYILNE